jgi:hypothetical protein
MSISSIGGANGLQSSLLGIQRGIANADRDSQVVAQASASPDGIDSNAVMGALIDAKVQALNVEASARAFAIQDQVIGSLIDIKV